MKATSATEILKSHLNIQSAEGWTFLDRVEVLMYIYRRKVGVWSMRGRSAWRSVGHLYTAIWFFWDALWHWRSDWVYMAKEVGERQTALLEAC